jgi:cytochrome c-type biogenesis protein CcmH/NrfG
MEAMDKPEAATPQNWKSAQVYAMAVVCLLIGITLGYLFRGSESRPSQPVVATAAADAAGQAPHPQMPTLDDMKRMADKQAEPLLAKLKNDPKNPKLLNQLGTVYKATHQFQQAALYYQKAVEADPKNIAARTDLASCMFYQGDADGAISQLQQALTYNPKDANSLFNLGMIRLQAKNDSAGAISSWRQLLKLNPTLPKEKKDQVTRLIAQAQQPKAAQ